MDATFQRFDDRHIAEIRRVSMGYVWVLHRDGCEVGRGNSATLVDAYRASKGAARG